MLHTSAPLHETHGRLVALARPVNPIAPLDFLRTAPPDVQRVHWQHSEDEIAFAGYGMAAEIVAYGRDRFASIKSQTDALFADMVFNAPAAAAPRLIGGFAFRDDFAATEGIWAAFPAAYFMLPRVQYTRIADQAWLTLNAVIDADEPTTYTLNLLNDELDNLIASLGQHTPQPRAHAVKIHYPLSRETWQKQITDATKRIRAGELEKVVLSRYADITFDAPVDPVAALETLDTNYPTAYRFLVEVYPGHAFYGATPELMGAKRGTSLATAALAGSRPRGTSETDDQAYAAELMASAKERSEHHFVVDALCTLLQPFVEQLSMPDEPTIMKLRNIQHLYTPVEVTLHDEAALLDIVAALHPTPALGGTPRREAVDAIRRIETTDRGWYAAPVGWIDANGDGTFVVAIRSAVSVEDQARLYAGVGIVADSDPDKEWDETALKFKPLLNALEAARLE